MGTFDDIRKAFQDILAPEIRGITQRLDAIDKRLETMSGDLHTFREEFRVDLRAVEDRMTRALEQAKREVLLTVQLAESEQRNATLLRKVNELADKSPQ